MRIRGNRDGMPTNDIKARSKVDWTTSGDNNDKCLAIFFITPDAEDISRMNNHYAALGLKLVTSPVSAKVVYYDSLTGQRIVQAFPLVATYVRTSATRCAAQAG
jgi:hypothetical protein